MHYAKLCSNVGFMTVICSFRPSLSQLELIYLCTNSFVNKLKPVLRKLRNTG